MISAADISPFETDYPFPFNDDDNTFDDLNLAGSPSQSFRSGFSNESLQKSVSAADRSVKSYSTFDNSVQSFQTALNSNLSANSSSINSFSINSRYPSSLSSSH